MWERGRGKRKEETLDKTNAKPSEAGSRWRGRTTKRSGCLSLRRCSGAEFVRTKAREKRRACIVSFLLPLCSAADNDAAEVQRAILRDSTVER